MDLEFDENELMQYAMDHGMIDTKELSARVEEMKRQDYLAQHTFSIWQNEHGQWLTHIRDEGGKKVIRRRATRKELEDFLVEHYKKQEPIIYIKDVFYEWIDERLGYGEIQKQSYDRYCTDFIRFFDPRLPICRKKFGNITGLDLEAFIKTSIRDHGLTRKSYAGLRTLIYGIFKYGKKHGYTKFSISEFMGDFVLPKNIFQKKYKPKNREVFDEDEILLVTDYLKEHADIWNMGLLLQFQTGMRIGEISALKWEDVDEDCIRVHRTERKYRVDGKWKVEVHDMPKTEAGNREIIIPPTAGWTIRTAYAQNPDGEYVFMNNDKRIRENTFNKRLESICQKLEIPVRSTHKIRKTYGTTLLDGNVDDSVVAEQMGHVDVATTRKLYYYSNKRRSTKVTQISNAIGY